MLDLELTRNDRGDDTVRLPKRKIQEAWCVETGVAGGIAGFSEIFELRGGVVSIKVGANRTSEGEGIEFGKVLSGVFDHLTQLCKGDAFLGRREGFPRWLCSSGGLHCGVDILGCGF